MTLPDPTSRTKTLLVSLLSLGRVSNVLALMTDLPRWLAVFGRDRGIDVHVVVRNNDPRVDFHEVGERLAQCEAEHAGLHGTLITGHANLGFGRGHNENYRLCPADYVLFLNDDIGFPHIAWLAEAIALLDSEPRTACVAASENPQYLNPMFGNGQMVGTPVAVETLRYAEASVLLFNGAVFQRIGMFDEALQWAMCEDADLSLRAQQLGYRLRWISMPHEHWRSTSVNSLPGPVKSSILEHNRALLFAAWAQTLATGRVGRLEVIDLWSDGIGDVFCALPHLFAWLDTLSPERRERIIVNTSHVELVELLATRNVRTCSVADKLALLEALDAEGIATLRTTRDVNYALPMNLHALLCGALGVPPCGEAGYAAFGDALRRDIGTLKGPALPADYCVVHLEFARQHDGRALSPGSIKSLLAQCGRHFESIVLIGRERRLSAKMCGTGRTNVVDLQGRLALRELIAVIAGARHFVGIDSFPAHVAQAAGVRSAVFFGAVHPLARVWDETRVWPLVAGLDCIGCYHTHLEPSAPFCMRRDEACSGGPEADVLEQTLQQMLRGDPYPWPALRQRFAALQAKLIGFMRHHPAPPERVLRAPTAANEQISNVLYRVLDQIADLVGNRYRTASLGGLTERVRELESDLFERDVELNELRQSRPQQAAMPPPQRDERPPERIVQLNALPLECKRCAVETSAQWLAVHSADNDPQVTLPLLRGHGGRVQLKLNAVADRVDTLQVFWSPQPNQFTENHQRALAISTEVTALDLAFDLAPGELLALRIDPLTARGRVKLRGSISGAFEPLVAEAPAAPPDESRRRSGRRRASA